MLKYPGEYNVITKSSLKSRETNWRDDSVGKRLTAED